SLRHLSKLARDNGPDGGADIEKLGSIALTVDGLGQAVVLTTPDGRIVHVSRAAEQTVGYSGSELVGRSLQELWPSDREFHLPDIQASSQTKPFTCDARLIRKNGSAFSAAVSISAISDDKGHVIGMACVLVDLTDVRTSEEAGNSVEEQTLLAEIGHLLSSTPDPWGDFERFAKLVCKLVPVDRVSLLMSTAEGGYTRDMVYPKRSDTSVATPENSYRAAPVSDGGVTPADAQPSPDSSSGLNPIYCPVVWEPLVSRGETFGYLQLSSIMLRPYTERELGLSRQVSALFASSVAGDRIYTELTDSVVEMRTREEQYRLFIEQGADALFLHDPLGNVLDVNDRACELSGLPREELLSASLAEFLGEGGPAILRETWEKILKGSVVFRETQLHRVTGEDVPVEARTGHFELGGRHLLLTLVRDISDSKKSEEERRRLEAQLAQAQKMEAVGQLAGGIAHDFNNLLSAVTSYSQLAKMKLPAGDPVNGYMDEILKASDRAANLTRQLLAFSRTQAIEPRVLCLSDLVLDIEKMLRRLISVDIEMVMLPDENEGMVKVDPGQAEQVLINLVVNARDAMENGGKLYIETKCVDVDNRYEEQYPEFKPGEYVMLSVSDTGDGMSEEVRRHIFEPFFTTKEQGRGTGLGLSTCYGIVAQNEGQILVDSEVGVGTTFRIYFPRIRQAADKLPLRDDEGYLPLGDETILLVEDEPLVRQVALIILREQGYNVLEATNGLEGLGIAEEHSDDRIDLLVTDLVMPLLGGKGLADKLSETHPETKVLFTSGYTDDATTRNMGPESGRDFLHKPFTPTGLAKKVRDVLDSG
ncbi:MAG: PAS domain S-box protein, partial [Chloroflexi bacterium]|nr:PAS domain S-box protein [Chloroflexota bacterium]